MSVRILSVGQVKEAFKPLSAPEDMYIKRMSPWLDISCERIKGEKVTQSVTAEKALAREAERFAPYIEQAQCTVVLSERGKHLTSEQFAAQLGKRLHWPATHGVSGGNRLNRGAGKTRSDSMIFIIGSAYGLAPSVMEQADWLVSLSAMTYPHDLVRLLLLEQLFRSYKILKNEPYHK